MNDENLVDLRTRSTSEVREIGRAGGKASGKKRAERKALREQLEMILSIPGNQDRLCAAIFEKACQGDARSFETIRDTIGEKPKETLELEGGVSFTFAGVGGDDICG